jgi:uncharacterized membrane protein
MKPLIVLLAVFITALVGLKLFKGRLEYGLAGRIALSAMLVFTAVAHFAFTKGMEMMLPPFIPFKTQVVYLTGLIEMVAAIGLLLPNLRVTTGWLLIAFFVLILPANVYAAIKQVNYQTGTFTGNGPSYLWFRVPLQLFFIAWTYISAIRL